MDNTPEILAECQLDHPFFIKEKGESAKKKHFNDWSSAIPSSKTRLSQPEH
jgi:hypothetical protein